MNEHAKRATITEKLNKYIVCGERERDENRIERKQSEKKTIAKVVFQIVCRYCHRPRICSLSNEAKQKRKKKKTVECVAVNTNPTGPRLNR